MNNLQIIKRMEPGLKKRVAAKPDSLEEQSEMRRKMDQLRKEVDNGGRIRIIQGLLADLNQTFRELYRLRMKG